MAQKTKSSKLYAEEDEQEKKQSINGVFADKEEDELMSINRALEKEKEQVSTVEEEDEIDSEQEEVANEQDNKVKKESAAKGVKIPPAKALRNPKKDKSPIEGEDLGLQENDFLLSRKITEKDLDLHNKVNKEALLGSNVRKHRDFMNVFSRGQSSKEKPKVDTMYAIENNQALQKEIAAKQLLRNYHSKNNKEKNNTIQIFTELKLKEDQLKEIKEDKKAFHNENLINLIKELL